jgi:hypothetical protein
MNLENYAQLLREQGMGNAEIVERVAVIGDFHRFLESPAGRGAPAAGKPEAERFARRLIAEGRNTLENFSALEEFAGRAGLNPLKVAWIELMDCHNALATLAAEIEHRHGCGLRDKIFSEPLPPLGADEKERCAYTREICGRMERLLSAEQSRAAWFFVRHGIPPEDWRTSDESDREKFLRSGDIDEFLALKRRERDALLTRLHDEDELWYTVQITDEVLTFVRSDPEMEAGFRRGEDIFITKIPYNAVRYLQESDPVLKRYYACHCPLVRQAILEGKPVSPAVCHCSLGHASHYLAGIGRAFRGEVLESAVRGDLRCRFVFHPAERRE